MAKRAIVIVLDGCGAGAAPDAAAFNDHENPSTLHHVWDACGGLHTPVLNSLGWFAAAGVPTEHAITRAGYGRLRPVSMGKDSVTGHWEMMGIETKVAFPTYPEGFPIALVKRFEQAIGAQTLGNKPSSGTVILDELGALHMELGCPILYTSADSVFQLAAHEEIVPLAKLYEWCEIARELCQTPDNVQRVIARPFVGDPKGGFKRTQNRKDYPAVPPPNWVDKIGDVFGVGVVPELFGGRGFRSVRRTQSNVEHAAMLKEAMASDAKFIFANFEDFDMLYGHRNDPIGFGKCLGEFDLILADVLKGLRPDDVLILTADHGNDPTDASTDHSREFVPWVVVQGTETGNLGDRDGMQHIGEAVARHLGVR